MVSDSYRDFEQRLAADRLRLEQLQLEAKATRLAAEAKALEAELEARRQAANQVLSARRGKSPAENKREVEKPREEATPPKKPALKQNAPPPVPLAPPKRPTASEPAQTSKKSNRKVSATPPVEAPQPSSTREKVAAVPMASAPLATASVASAPVESAPQVIPTHDFLPSPPASNVEQEESEVPAEAAGPGGLSRLLATTPSYLVSAIFHLVALIVLGLIMLPSPQDLVKQLVVTASTLEEEDMEIQDLVIESPEEMEPVEFEEPLESQAIDVADPGAADLGAVAQDIPTEVSTYSVAMNDTTVDSIGLLFGSEGQGMTNTMNGAGGAEFFGVKAAGRKFVFIVDSSKSMNKGKFEAACEELMYSLMRLNKDQYFYVLFFDHDAARMTFDGNAQPEPRAVAANSTNINKVGRWVATVELELQTNPFDCVEFALTLNPDAIFILTDGKFTDRGRTVKYLKQNNLYEDPFEGTKPKTVIHTVGFYQRDGEETLIPLAKTHGGTYRFVPPPEPMKK